MIITHTHAVAFTEFPKEVMETGVCYIKKKIIVFSYTLVEYRNGDADAPYCSVKVR